MLFMSRTMRSASCLCFLLGSSSVSGHKPHQLVNEETKGQRFLDYMPVPVPTFTPYGPPPTPPPTLPLYAPPPTPPPTEAPTSSPSGRPSPAPSPSPTLAPSALSTATPTVKPSVAPTSRPSGRPSVSPSDSPSLSLEPSQTPSGSDEPSLSLEPTEEPDIKDFTILFKDLSLTLYDTKLKSGDKQDWADITEKFIEKFFSAKKFGFPFIEVTLSQITFDTTQINGQGKGKSKKGKGYDYDTEVTYDQLVRLSFESDDIPIGDLATLWLHLAQDREAYVNKLNDSNNKQLQDVTDVSEVTVPKVNGRIPVVVNVEEIEMTLFGISDLSAPGRWKGATRDFTEDYVSKNLGSFDSIRNFEASFPVNNDPSVDGGKDNVVLTYSPEFDFDVADEKLVPELVQKLSALPFCRSASRKNYVENYLNDLDGLEDVTSSSQVRGTDFDCP